MIRIKSMISKALLICALFGGVSMPQAYAENDLAKIKRLVEGTYDIVEWYTGDNELFRPPTVKGRVSFHGGMNQIIQHNFIKESPQFITASYGHYELTPTTFAYTYDEPSFFTLTKEGIKVTHTSGFAGLRKFNITQEPHEVRFRSENGEQEWLFTAESFTYEDTSNSQWKGKRVYRRVTPLE